MATSAVAPIALGSIPEGKITQTIYSLIRDGRHSDVIRLMKNEVSSSPKSRAALSLLAFCYYQTQDYASAADVYEKLTRFFPDVTDYKMSYAQSLYKSAQYSAAQKVCHSIEPPEYAQRVRAHFLNCNIHSYSFTSLQIYAGSQTPGCDQI
jgi:tetratricopeptide repeat protein 30